MNRFDSFLRFFALTDDNNTRPQNLNLPAEPYPILPVVPADALRWLVPLADCGGRLAHRLSIGIRAKGNSGPGVLCGRIRQQAGATYSEIRLRVDALPIGYRQFALMAGSKNVMGTFRGQALSQTDYVEAIAEHYRAFPYAATDVDVTGRDIRVRVYNNDLFSLHGETLRVDVGNVREPNSNSPSLIALKSAGLGLPAENWLTLSVSADIQPGNVFGLDGIAYKATGGESPNDILIALGAPTGKLSKTGGASVVAYAQPGTQVVDNANRPGLQLLFDSNSGGNDRYLAVVGVDVQPGNVYQVAASGVATKTVTAVLGDTKASIEAQFNNSPSGKFLLPTGAGPIVTAIKGTQTLPNTNNPVLGVEKTKALPARTVDRYTVYVGSSVVRGNSYGIVAGGVETSATASEYDTPLSIAAKLGYTQNPFTVDVVVGAPVVALARRGPRYHAPADVAPVTLLSVRTGPVGLPYVAEVVVPNLTVGTYQLVLREGVNVVGVSNYLHLKADGRDTSMVRFGAGGNGSVFGLNYAEDGLLQRFRLPVHLDSGRLRQSESLYRTLDNKTVRGRTSARFAHGLTTRGEGDAFHRNLYTALKSPVLLIDDKPYTCEGEYTETPMQGRSRRRQGTAELMALEEMDYRNAGGNMDNATESASGNYAAITELNGVDGLWLAAKRLNFTTSLDIGTLLPAADYELLLRCGADALQLTIGINGSRVATFLLSANTLNRMGPVRLAPGTISLNAHVTTAIVTQTGVSDYRPQDAEVVSDAPQTITRPGDFNEDFSSDYSQ